MIIDGSGTGVAEPRRRFSDDKARIVSEAMLPGASVSDVARRYRVCSSLVYRWRRALLRDDVAVEAPRLPAPAFVPVEVAGVAPLVSPEQLGPGVVEVVGPAGSASASRRRSTRWRRSFSRGFARTRSAGLYTRSEASAAIWKLLWLDG